MTEDDARNELAHERFKLELIGLLVLSAGSIIGIVQTFYAIRAANAARDAASAAREQTITAKREYELSERPWLSTVAQPSEPIQIIEEGEDTK